VRPRVACRAPRRARRRARGARCGLFSAATTAVLSAALAGFLIGGIAHGVKNVLARTLIHQRVPDALRGRVYATYNAARNGAELGALALGGALVGIAGARVALLLSGAVPIVIALAALALTTRRPANATAAPYAGRPWTSGTEDLAAH
jgi:sugar phosphate permease